jgi:hypothetical protein
VRQVLGAYAAYTRVVPDELYLDCFINIGESDAARVLEPLSRFGRVLSDDVGAVSYLVLQGSDKQPEPRASTARPATEAYQNAGSVEGIDAGLFEVIGAVELQPGRNSRMLFQPAGGAIARLPAAATAFNHRSATHAMPFVVSWKLDDRGAGNRSYAEGVWRQLKKYTRGFYTNDLAGGVTPARGSRELWRKSLEARACRACLMSSMPTMRNLFRLSANMEPRAVRES